MDKKEKLKLIYGYPLHRKISREEYWNIGFMNKDYRNPKEADPKALWAHLKIKYKDGDEFIDEDLMIWDVWKKGEGFALYCQETKEIVEVPKPKLGG